MKMDPELFEPIKKHIENKAVPQALDGLRTLITDHGESEVIAHGKKKAVFRYSSYDFCVPSLREVVLQLEKELKESASKQYFGSVANLGWGAEGAEKILRTIESSLIPADIIGCLASIDFLFYSYSSQQGESKHASWRSFTIEELSTAFSYLYPKFAKSIKPTDLMGFDTAKVANHTYCELLATVSSVLQIREAEIKIDSFGYVASIRDDCCFITATDDSFERSLRMGYILHQTRQIAFSLDKPAGSILIHEAILNSHSKWSDAIIKLEYDPIDHLRIHYVRPEDLGPLLGAPAALYEDHKMMELIRSELLIDDVVYKTPLLGPLSPEDITALQRLFLAYASMVSIYCAATDIFKNDAHIRGQLNIPLRPNLSAYLTAIFNKEKSESFLEYLVWKESSDSYFDLQYQPFLEIEDRIVIPMAIASSSSLTRNLLVRHSVRFDADSGVDPVGMRLGKSLKTRFPAVGIGVNYPGGDLDVVAVGEKSLFVLECKNTVLSSSSIEARGCLDQVKKASTQLARFRGKYQDPTIREKMRLELGVKEALPLDVQSCIVLGVSTFAGLQYDTFPVRPINELCDFLDSGNLLFGIGEKDGVRFPMRIPIWSGPEFSENDLVHALSKNSFWSDRLLFMTDDVSTYTIGERQLSFNTYQQDLKAFRATLFPTAYEKP